jgi:hypothetical protein
MAVDVDAGNPEYAGNLARALDRSDQDPAEIGALLQDLVFNDTRPEWVAWAKHQLNLRESLRAAAPRGAMPQRLEVAEPVPPPQHVHDLPLSEALEPRQ